MAVRHCGSHALALITFATLARLSVAERDTDGAMALTVEADTHFKRMARKRASATIETVSSARTAGELRRALSRHFLTPPDAQGVAKFHVKAQATILEAVQLWSNLEEPGLHPNVSGGVMILGDGFFEAAELLLDESVKSIPAYPEFKETWKAAYTDIVKIDEEVGMHVREYAMRAEPQGLEHVVRLCTKTAIDLVKRYLPEAVVKPVSGFMGGVEDIMEGISEAWTDATRGDSGAAMEDVVGGMREASDAVLPNNTQKRASYEIIFGALDPQIVRLNQHVLAYTRKLQEKLVCQRDLQSRDRRAPIMSLLQTKDVRGDVQRGQESLDVALKRKGASDKKASNKQETKKPSCDANSEFKELIGDSCYSTCKAGFMPMATQRDSCLSVCPSDLPEALPGTVEANGVIDGVMCGATLRILQLVQEEVVGQSKKEDDASSAPVIVTLDNKKLDDTSTPGVESKPGELANSALEDLLAGIRSGFEARQSIAFNFTDCASL